MINVYHSGHFGDIIYGLRAVKQLAENRNDSVTFWLRDRDDVFGRGGEKTKPLNTYLIMKGLLEYQPYISAVELVGDHVPGDVINLDMFRKQLGAAMGHLGVAHYLALGIKATLHEFRKPWIDVYPVGIAEKFAVINKTKRYFNASNNWNQIIDKYVRPAADKAYFVGLPAEYEFFKTLVTPETLAFTEFMECRSLFHAATFIKAATIYAGNCSANLAIAAALGKRRVIDCSTNPNVRASVFTGAEEEIILG